MTTYISLLRAINVGGQNRISMTDLKAVHESLEMARVETYVQSGNVVFQGAAAHGAALESLIETRIHDWLGLEVPVLVRTPQELQQLVDRHPFTPEQLADPTRVAVIFLRAAPDGQLLTRLAAPDVSGDRFYPAGRAIYLFCPNGFGRTRLTNTFFETKLKVTATSRNWKTVNALLDMARNREAL